MPDAPTLGKPSQGYRGAPGERGTERPRKRDPWCEFRGFGRCYTNLVAFCMLVAFFLGLGTLALVGFYCAAQLLADLRYYIW